MIADVGSLQIIGRWLANLADLVRHAEAKPGKDQLALYASMLGRVLPAGAFTADSLQHIASTTVWWPHYAALHLNLMAWWYDHRPPGAPLLLTVADQAEHLGVLDHAWVDYYARRTSENLTPERLENLRSLVRQQSPAAWKIVRPPVPAEDRVGAAQMADLRRAFEAHVPPPTPAEPPPPPRRAPGLTPEQLAASRAEGIARLREAAARNVR